MSEDYVTQFAEIADELHEVVMALKAIKEAMFAIDARNRKNKDKGEE